MRPDMAKVVTERPRRGHGIGLFEKNRLTATRGRVRPCDVDVDDDELPRSVVTRAHKHPISPRRGENAGWDSKNFSDLLGPLQRYLRKQIGRRWDDVHSELCSHLDKRGITGSHIWDHVWQYVERHAYMCVDGKVRVRGRYGYEGEPRWYYVHPYTGILCEGLGNGRYYRQPTADKGVRRLRDALSRFGLTFDRGYPRVLGEKPKPQFDPTAWVIVDDLTVLERTDHGWFQHKYKALDPYEVVKVIEKPDGRKVSQTRMDLRLPLKQRVWSQQLGRKSPLWKLTQR